MQTPLHFFTGEMTKEMQRGLILVSKLLQAMANRSAASFVSPKIAAKNSKMIIDFVELHQATLHQFVAQLTDEQLIERLQSTRPKFDSNNLEVQAELEDLEDEMKAIMDGQLMEEPTKNNKGDVPRRITKGKSCSR